MDGASRVVGPLLRQDAWAWILAVAAPMRPGSRTKGRRRVMVGKEQESARWAPQRVHCFKDGESGLRAAWAAGMEVARPPALANNNATAWHFCLLSLVKANGIGDDRIVALSDLRSM